MKLDDVVQIGFPDAKDWNRLSGSQGVALDDASRRHRLSCLVGEALQNGVVTRRDLKVFILVRAMEVSPREAAAPGPPRQARGRPPVSNPSRHAARRLSRFITQ